MAEWLVNAVVAIYEGAHTTEGDTNAFCVKELDGGMALENFWFVPIGCRGSEQMEKEN